MLAALTSLGKDEIIREYKPKPGQKLHYDLMSLLIILGYLLRMPECNEDSTLWMHVEDILKYAPFHID